MASVPRPTAKPRRTGDLTVALLYTRVSSDEQAREGVSLDVQLREGRQYVARQPGWVIGREYQDVMSGSRDDRTDYQALLAEARRLRAEGQPVAVVVVALDRFGRKLLERVRSREELKALSVPTHSTREGGEVPDLVANVLAAVAQEEVRRLGERTSAVKQHLLAAGWFPGGRVPWGYVLRDATLAERAQGAPLRVLDVDPLVVPYVVEAYRRLAAGATLRAVARWVFALPEPVRAGRMLTYASIRRLLASPTYAGRVTRDGPPAQWPPLVDLATWDAAQARVAAHQHMPRQGTGKYLLTGLLRCPQCGGRLRGALRNDRGRRYVCRAREAGVCGYTVPAPAIEPTVLADAGALVAALTQGSPAFQAALRRAWRTLANATPAPRRQTAPLEAVVAQARQRLTRLALLYADGAIDQAGYEQGRDAARADLDAATAELARLAPAAPAPLLPPIDEVLRAAGGWAALLSGSDAAAQREVLAALIDCAVPERTGRGVYHVAITWTAQGAALGRAAALAPSA